MCFVTGSRVFCGKKHDSVDLSLVPSKSVVTVLRYLSAACPDLAPFRSLQKLFAPNVDCHTCAKACNFVPATAEVAPTTTEVVLEPEADSEVAGFVALGMTVGILCLGLVATVLWICRLRKARKGRLFWFMVFYGESVFLCLCIADDKDYWPRYMTRNRMGLPPEPRSRFWHGVHNDIERMREDTSIKEMERRAKDLERRAKDIREPSTSQRPVPSAPEPSPPPNKPSTSRPVRPPPPPPLQPEGGKMGSSSSSSTGGRVLSTPESTPRKFNPARPPPYVGLWEDSEEDASPNAGATSCKGRPKLHGTPARPPPYTPKSPTPKSLAEELEDCGQFHTW